MPRVISRPDSGPTNSVGTAMGPVPGIHPSSDAPAVAATERLRAGRDERGNCEPDLGGGAAMSVAPTDPRASDPPDDSGQGLAMLAIVTGAALIVTGAVALLALVNSWWMLGVAFGIHIAMTVVVVLAIFHAMAARSRPDHRW